MLPLKDDVRSQSFPLFTVLLIAGNVGAFLYQMSLELGAGRVSQEAATAFIIEFGAVPCRITGLCPLGEFPAPAVSVFTSMFLHGGLFHIAGNMLYLWIFGDNVEDTLGHARFLLLYLLAGVAAVAAQTVVNPASQVPMVGASGAISGVLGAYLLLFPRASILTLIMFGFFVRFVQVPALIVLGFWIVVQFFNGLISFGARGTEGGGVAWFAHIGGFLAGLALLFLLRPRARRRL
ncbi:MAG: rhomboid family intramembrane serine protease [Candidatus Rokubacteria bacterium]|nr:rhomboid family intramembrane serine protease [Candidatus Rokubacteria bacterium]